MKYLRDIIEEQIEFCHTGSDVDWTSRARRASGPRLHPSSVAGCTRAAILTAVHPFPDNPLRLEQTHPFDLYTKSVMLSGNVWEREISNMLKSHLGYSYEATCECDTELWAWELDGVLKINTEMFPDGLIIELKDTAEYNFRVKSRLPYEHHAVQLMVYQALENRALGFEIPARLYYNGRGHWAEFDVHADDHYIYCEGRCDDQQRSVEFEFNIAARMNELEVWFLSGELPPREDTPFERQFGCVRGTDKKGYHPNCRWFSACFPEMPAEGPFSKTAYG